MTTVRVALVLFFAARSREMPRGDRGSAILHLSNVPPGHKTTWIALCTFGGLLPPGESKPKTFCSPVQGQADPKILKIHAGGLPALQDAFHDVRGSDRTKHCNDTAHTSSPVTSQSRVLPNWRAIRSKISAPASFSPRSIADKYPWLMPMRRANSA
jgi:hypothetical protein